MKILSPMPLHQEGVHSFKGVCDATNKPVNVILNMKAREDDTIGDIGMVYIES